MTRHQLAAGLCAPLLAAAVASCGMRGRPLPPLIILPAAVADLEAVRLGDEVHLHFTIPETNADGSQPPDIRRVEIYALTTLPGPERPEPDLAEWIEAADPVFTFDVVVPVEPEPGEAPQPAAADADVDAALVYVPGESVMVIEALTPELVEPPPVEPQEEPEEEAETDAAVESRVEPLALPFVSPPLPRAPRRTYAAVVVSGRNRRSEPAAAQPVPVEPAPEPPAAPELTYDETSVAVAWQPPASARLPVQQPVAEAPVTTPETASDAAAEEDVASDAAPDAADAAPEAAAAAPDAAAATPDAAAPDAAAATPDAAAPDAAAAPPDVAPTATDAAAAAADETSTAAGDEPSGPLASTALLPPQIPSRYDVYDVTPPGAAQPSADADPEAETDAEAGGLPRPLNAEPLEATSHTGAQTELGGERCFMVRTVDTVDPVDGLLLRSPASESTCVQLVDVFPPPPPSGLVAVGGGGAISLTWTASDGADVRGYVVLRGRGPDGDLIELTPEPIATTNYRDADVESGVTYVYAVQALDEADTPNRSPESERVTEQAP